MHDKCSQRKNDRSGAIRPGDVRHAHDGGNGEELMHYCSFHVEKEDIVFCDTCDKEIPEDSDYETTCHECWERKTNE